MNKRMNAQKMRRIDPTRLKKASLSVQKWWRTQLFTLRIRRMVSKKIMSKK